MVRQVLIVDPANKGASQYNSFLGLQNTIVGEWFNDKVFNKVPTKKKYDDAVAKGNLAEMQNSITPSPYFDVAPSPEQSSGDTVTTQVIYTENNSPWPTPWNKPQAPRDVASKILYGVDEQAHNAQMVANMQSATNQLPKKKNYAWIWIVVAAGVVGGGYYWYKKHKQNG